MLNVRSSLSSDTLFRSEVSDAVVLFGFLTVYLVILLVFILTL